MNVKKIIINYLLENGYGGLINTDGNCGCEIDDIMPCNAEGIEMCKPAYKKKFDKEDCDDCTYECERTENDWCMSTKKIRGKCETG